MNSLFIDRILLPEHLPAVSLSNGRRPQNSPFDSSVTPRSGNIRMKLTMGLMSMIIAKNEVFHRLTKEN